MRTVVLTSGGDHARRILLALSVRDLVPQGLLLVSPLPSSSRRMRATRSILRRGPRKLLAGVLRRALAAVEPAAVEWEALAEETRRSGPLGGERMLADLRELRPDYLLLAGVGLLGADALAVPARGTINVHPGLLPWARGVGVVDRSLERGIAVGVSAHYVSEGVDTGAVIRRELVPVHDRDTLASLRAKADERCAAVAVELAARVRAGEHPDSAAQRGVYPYCSWPSGQEAARIERAVRAGRAVELYERWLGFYGSRELPLEDHRDPLAASSGSAG